MTKDKLIEIIGNIVQYEVNKAIKVTRKEMQMEISKAVNNLKVQLLQEMKSKGTTIKSTDPIGKIHSEFRKQYEVPQRNNPKYTNNPLLNELLTKTKPLAADELNEEMAPSVLDNVGKVRGNNPLAEVFTRDYSELVGRMTTKPQAPKVQPQIKANPTAQTEQFRNSIMSKMMGDDDLGNINYDAEIEEDLSWMNKLA
jgi:hypothetical protein